MKRASHTMAFCAMCAALGVIVMLLGALTGLGTYAAPILASLILIPVQGKYGVKNALLVWLATGLLSLMLTPDWEQGIVYLTIFGWFPAVRPLLEEKPRIWSLPLRYLLFNAAAILSYAAMMPLLGLEEELNQPWLWAAALLLGNLVFFLEDHLLIPRMTRLLKHYLRF